MRSTRVERKKLRRKSNSGLKKESGRWRPTTRQVFWAIGIVLTLMTIALLVVQLYPGLWEAVSREPVAMLKGRFATLIGIGVALTVLIVLLAKGSASLGWTGFRGKTLWDLLQVLIVPLVLVGIGLVFEMQQTEREERRAEVERELAEERAQDEALQAYLDQMGDLLLAKDGLRESEEGSEVRTLARARTITVLERLEDPSRKTAIMRFLVETELVQRVEGRAPIIHLSFADLSGAPLFGADLRGADLYRADLRGADLNNAVLIEADLWQANLRGADLSFADLSGVDLDNANLSDADLSEANLSDAHLWQANLSDAVLSRADLSDAVLSEANLRGANLSDVNYLSRTDLSEIDLDNADLSRADLSDADLSGDDLRGADLSGANLSGVDLDNANLSDAVLSEAHLRGANLRGADLSRTDLSGAEGVTNEKLEQQAKTLNGATMPDGTVLPERYATKDFEPALSLSLSGDGWQLHSETPDLLSFEGPDGGLLFNSPLRVLDPSNPSEPKEVPAPENTDEWVSWFRTHPNLDTSKPVPVSVGGASGVRIDVTNTSPPESYPHWYCDKQPCVLLFPSGVASFVGQRDRFVIVDVGGKTVVIDVGAPEDKFDEFVPKAQKVLDTVEWKGG
jgi:uncharacterized protein YjbI with pentapeptide repeats